MEKLDKLTKKQEKELIEFREEWRRIGTSTERIDKQTIKEAIVEMYKLLGKSEPKFVFVSSPFFANLQINFCSKVVFPKIQANLGANLGANLRANLEDNLGANLWANLEANLGANLRANLRANLEDNLWANLGANLGANLRDNLGDNLGDNLRDNLWANLGANLGANLRDNLWDNLEANLGANLRANLGANLRANLGDNLWANLWDNLRDNLWANLGANLRDNLGANLRANLEDNKLPKELKELHNTYFWGQMDSYWVAFYKFPELKLGITYTKEKSELLELWAKIAKSSCWWWAFENYVFVSDRPTKLNFNKNYRLHSDSQSAYEFSDGWNAYYLNGVKFKKDLWEKIVSRKMTFKEVAEIEDIDQRTQAMAYCPPREFLETQGKLLDKSERGNELWLIPQEAGLFRVDAYYLLYQDKSSGREYMSGIDPEIGKKGNADEGQAWKFQLELVEYSNLKVET